MSESKKDPFENRLLPTARDEKDESYNPEEEGKQADVSKDKEGLERLVPRLTITNNTSEIFCLRFSPDGKYLAAGCGDGAIRVFNTYNGSLAYNLQGGSNVALPTTAIRFRPNTETQRTKNVFIAANATGLVQHWHMTSAKCVHSMEDEGNQVYAIDYNDVGTSYCTAGKDKAIRLYDEATKTLITKMEGGGIFRSAPGHSNRIFSTKFAPLDPHVIVSGGWDNTVQFWDIRQGQPVRSIYGPHICGDALDICGNEVVTGSWRGDDQLQLWDFRTCEKIQDINWSFSSSTSAAAKAANSYGAACFLYAAQFSKEGRGRYIAAGGSNVNEAKIFDHHNNNECVGTVTGLARGVFTLDFSPEDNKIAIAGGDCSIRVLEIAK